MFKNQSCYNEVLDELEKNISNNSSMVKKASDDKKLNILNKLSSISEKLDNLGYEKESEATLKIINIFSNCKKQNIFEKLAKEDNLLEGGGEYKREISENEAFEDEYLKLLLDENSYHDNELNKTDIPKDDRSEFLNLLFSDTQYDKILNDLVENNNSEEDNVEIL